LSFLFESSSREANLCGQLFGVCLNEAKEGKGLLRKQPQKRKHWKVKWGMMEPTTLECNSHDFDKGCGGVASSNKEIVQMKQVERSIWGGLWDCRGGWAAESHIDIKCIYKAYIFNSSHYILDYLIFLSLSLSLCFCFHFIFLVTLRVPL